MGVFFLGGTARHHSADLATVFFWGGGGLVWMVAPAGLGLPQKGGYPCMHSFSSRLKKWGRVDLGFDLGLRACTPTFFLSWRPKMWEGAGFELAHARSGHVFGPFRLSFKKTSRWLQRRVWKSRSRRI